MPSSDHAEGSLHLSTSVHNCCTPALLLSQHAWFSFPIWIFGPHRPRIWDTPLHDLRAPVEAIITNDDLMRPVFLNPGFVITHQITISLFERVATQQSSDSPSPIWQPSILLLLQKQSVWRLSLFENEETTHTAPLLINLLQTSQVKNNWDPCQLCG